MKTPKKVEERIGKFLLSLCVVPILFVVALIVIVISPLIPLAVLINPDVLTYPRTKE